MCRMDQKSIESAFITNTILLYQTLALFRFVTLKERSLVISAVLLLTLTFP